jgi:colanic acid/amylovoran biosynthesis glycosyltransferase
MAVGLPVLATRHGGIPELVEDGVHGVLVAERDAEAVAEGLSRLIGMRARWPEMGAAGRARVLAVYDRPVVTRRLVGAYRDLFGAGGSPR